VLRKSNTKNHKETNPVSDEDDAAAVLFPTQSLFKLLLRLIPQFTVIIISLLIDYILHSHTINDASRRTSSSTSDRTVKTVSRLKELLLFLSNVIRDETRE
jgi:hypothetical protein